MMRATSARYGALLLVLIVAGCKSPPSTTLTLDVAPPGAEAVRAGYAGPPLAIPAVHVPAAIDRVEFVRQIAAGQMQVDDFARWSAPLGTLARDALVRDLTARLPAGTVLPPGSTGGGRSLTLDVTILSYSVSGSRATMQAAYRPLPKGVVRQVVVEIGMADPSPTASANAFAALLGKFADRIADELPLHDS